MLTGYFWIRIHFSAIKLTVCVTVIDTVIADHFGRMTSAQNPLPCYTPTCVSNGLFSLYVSQWCKSDEMSVGGRPRRC